MEDPRWQREEAQPSSPRHMVLPAPAADADAPQALLPIPEPGLVDILLCVSRYPDKCARRSAVSGKG